MVEWILLHIDTLDFYGGGVYIFIVFLIVNRFVVFFFHAFITNVMRIWSFLWIPVQYIEDITRWRDDMNFIFEWQNNILPTSAASE